ncbi:FAD-dependent monooxygenase [Nocardia albiluteola]|uniref:FAD-dependent monooxygenase n=1 Tax=Nocardia albiluteola TaxID=2842303 RepID=UPI001FD9E334|nr:FAD-dependent monooxygenase [Nocardia albiluteola]
MAVECTEVLVIGAGPVGLLLGCELARRGVAVRVIDKKPGTVPTGARGRALSARSLEVLDDVGVVDRIYARGKTNPKARLYDGDTLVREVDPRSNAANLPTPNSPHRCSFVELPQQSTEDILAEHLELLGVRVEFDCELIDLDQSRDQVTATVRVDGVNRQVRAAYAVGCDGGGSRTRKLAGISFPGQTDTADTFVTGCAIIDGLDPDYLHIWANGVLLTWQPDLGRWVFFGPITPDGDGGITPFPADALRRVFDEQCGLPGITFRETSQTSIWRPNIRMATHYRKGRVFLAGDAAHIHPPTGGQGMNTGLQDAYNLGWKLAHTLRGAPEALLDTYEAERLPVAREVLATTSQRFDSVTRTSDPRERLRTASNTLSATDIFADTTQLSITYRHGPLARDLDDTVGIRAGDRAPDAPGLRCGDRSTRLFDLFRGPHLTLLHFGTHIQTAPATGDLVRALTIVPRGEAAPANGGVFVDSGNHAHHAYRITTPATILVRPDGYIALTGAGYDETAIADYLHLVVPR